jgi:hypothetical protein
MRKLLKRKVFMMENRATDKLEQLDAPWDDGRKRLTYRKIPTMLRTITFPAAPRRDNRKAGNSAELRGCRSPTHSNVLIWPTKVTRWATD